MHLKELKAKNPSDLLIYAESLDIENASTLRIWKVILFAGSTSGAMLSPTSGKIEENSIRL